MQSLPVGSTRSVQTWRPVWAARFVVLGAFLDLFMQFPVVAPYARSLGASASLIGIVVGAYSITNLIGNVVAGEVLDRWGRRWPVLIGLLGTAAALIGYVFARAPEQLMIARGVHGLMAAVLTPGAFAVLGDSASPSRRARVMGISGAMIGIAAVAGPSISGVLAARLGFHFVFLLSAALMAANLAAFWLLTGGQPESPQPPAAESHVLTGLWSLMRRAHLIAACLAALALTAGLGTLVTYLPIALLARGESSARTGLAFTVFAIAATIAMASPLNRVSDRYGRPGPIRAGLGVTCAGLLVLGFYGDLAGAMAGMAVFGLGFGTLFPAMTASVIEAAGPNERGKAFGIFYAVFSLGVVIGSVVSGFLADSLGETTGAPFLVAGALALAAIPSTAIGWRRRREPVGG